MSENSAYVSYNKEDQAYTSFHVMLGTVGSFVAAAIVLVVVLALPSLMSLRSVLFLMIVTLMLETVLQTPQIIASKRYDFHRIAVIEMSSVFAWLLLTVLGSLFVPTVLALVTARFAEAAVRGGFLLSLWYRHNLLISWHYRPELMRYFLSVCAHFGSAWMGTEFRCQFGCRPAESVRNGCRARHL